MKVAQHAPLVWRTVRQLHHRSTIERAARKFVGNARPCRIAGQANDDDRACADCCIERYTHLRACRNESIGLRRIAIPDGHATATVQQRARQCGSHSAEPDDRDICGGSALRHGDLWVGRVRILTRLSLLVNRPTNENCSPHTPTTTAASLLSSSAQSGACLAPKRAADRRGTSEHGNRHAANMGSKQHARAC